MSKNDPAFPLLFESSGGDIVEHYGLTKLEWFAGQALSFIVVRSGVASHEQVAERCFDLAKAMLKEAENLQK